MGSDSWIALAAASNDEFAHLATAAGRPEWSEDPRFADPAARKQNEAALDELIAAWTAGHRATDLETSLRTAGVPAARVRDAYDVLEADQLWQRGSLTWVEHPEAGRHAQMAAPWSLSRTPGGVTRPAPGLGEHSRELLARYLGIDDTEYERLVSLGITGEGPPD